MLGTLFPQRVPFQHVLLLHQLFMFASVAVTRVAPVLFPPGPPGTEGGVDLDPRMLDAAAEKLLQLSKNANQEGLFAIYLLKPWHYLTVFQLRI